MSGYRKLARPTLDDYDLAPSAWKSKERMLDQGIPVFVFFDPDLACLARRRDREIRAINRKCNQYWRDHDTAIRDDRRRRQRLLDLIAAETAKCPWCGGARIPMSARLTVRCNFCDHLYELI